MSRNDALQLKPGDRVRWTYPGDGAAGIVDRVETHGAAIRWEGDRLRAVTYLFDARGSAGFEFVEREEAPR